MSIGVTEYVTRMVDGYVDAALWVGVWDRHGELAYDDVSRDAVSADTLASAAADVQDFVTAMWSVLSVTEPWMSGPEQAGHDFFLTRNGHGAGFWDRGAGAAGDELSDAARPYGPVDWMMLDDGSVVG